MRVVVFDIDGTLTNTSEIDGHYFSASVRNVLRIPFEPGWSEFQEVTDAAILADLCARHSSRPYEQVEAEVQEDFFGQLEGAVKTDPDAIRAIEGAPSIFGEVRRAGWTPAIATGGWQRSAQIKLTAAGIPTGGVPLVSSSDYVRRVDIVQAAIRHASGGESTTEVVSVGDGTWDVKAAQALGIPLIGRATGKAGQKLLDQGAAVVVPHFADPESFLSLLEDIVVG